MKNIVVLFFLIFSVQTFANDSFDKETDKVIHEMYLEIKATYLKYELKLTAIQEQIDEVNTKLIQNKSTEEKLELLILKDKLKETYCKIQIDNTSDISKIRYIKGLQIIKILYEKVLGLDHHFASVRTFSEISKMANPN